MNSEVVERRRKEAIIRGCEYIGDAVGEYTAKYQYGSYKLACGHIQDIKRVHFLKGKYRCKQCLLDKYAQEAGATGLIITNHRPLEHFELLKKELWGFCE